MEGDRVSRDRLIEAFDEIVSPDLRSAIVAAVVDAQFVESVISGGGDTYTKTAAGAQKSKPEASPPTGVEYARHFRAVIRGFSTVTETAAKIAVRLDELREIHDHGRANVVTESDRRKAAATARHLTRKLTAAVSPAEDERG